MMIIQSNSIYYLPRENIYLDYKSERRMDPMIELSWLIETFAEKWKRISSINCVC
jgi:hypothetical protein